MALQIWPHAAQRQYVKVLTSLLVVLTWTDVQKGQLFGTVVFDVVSIDSRRYGRNAALFSARVFSSAARASDASFFCCAAARCGASRSSSRIACVLAV